jgi:hypothetical protein
MWKLFAAISILPIAISIGYFIIHKDNIMAVVFILLVPLYFYIFSLLKE